MESSVKSEEVVPIFSIALTNGMESIKEIYFKEGRGSVFTYKPTKLILITTFIFILLSGLFYLLSFSDKAVWISLFSVSIMVLACCLFIFFMRAKKYFQWKKGVDGYLKTLSKYEKQYLNLYLHSFEIVNEDETIIEKWKSIRKASISLTHITLNSETGASYLFPVRSMKTSEYEELGIFIRQKMKDAKIVVSGSAGKEGDVKENG